jgi:hypothetical protein
MRRQDTDSAGWGGAHFSVGDQCPGEDDGPSIKAGDLRARTPMAWSGIRHDLGLGTLVAHLRRDGQSQDGPCRIRRRSGY